MLMSSKIDFGNTSCERVVRGDMSWHFEPIARVYGNAV